MLREFSKDCYAIWNDDEQKWYWKDGKYTTSAFRAAELTLMEAGTIMEQIPNVRLQIHRHPFAGTVHGSIKELHAAGLVDDDVLEMQLKREGARKPDPDELI